MKSLIFIALLGLSTQAHALLGFDQTHQPLLICKNQMVQVKLETLADQKDVQLIVNDLRLDSMKNTVYTAVVHPVSSPEMQLFINAQASLRVAPEGKSLRGFLTLNRNMPSVGQVLECETYFRILPTPVAAETL